MNKLFFLIFFIIIAGIGFAIFIIPDYKALQKTNAEVAELEKNIEIIKNLETSREALQKQKLSISSTDMERLEKIVPSSPENIQLIIQLDELAKKNGLTMLTNISYDAAIEELPLGQVQENIPDYREYEVKFQTVGQYNQFVLFLEEVEKNLRLVDITSVVLKNIETQARSPVPLQSFNVTLKAYWLSESYE